ncbi:erythromycin esterase family protein [Deinococcus radiopugnans]
MNMRDRMMGENAVFLANEQFAGQKLIIWAASSHSAKRLDNLQGEIDRGQLPMGAFVHRALGSRAYTLGFTAIQGQFGAAQTGAARTTIERPVPGSFEQLFSQTNLSDAFLNLRDQRTPWLSEVTKARPFGYVWSEGDWTNTLDGLFFIREMKPSTLRPR